MRRLLLAFFVFLLIGIGLSLIFRNHQGYVLIAFHGWQIETSLLFVCGALLVGFWVVLAVWRLLVALVFAPRAMRLAVARRRRRRARQALYSGLEFLAEARWSRAEHDLETLADANEAPGLNHLYAARAAQQQSHDDDRDRYLDKAASGHTVSELAVELTRAELQVAAGQIEDAGRTLERVVALEPRHPWALRMYGEQTMESGDYDRLYALLPELNKHAALAPERLDAMAVAAHRHHLSAQTDIGGLTAAWRQVPRELRERPAIVQHYVGCLRRQGADNEAANVIRHALKQHWSPELVLLFGDLKYSDRTEQLATVEEWIHAHGQAPELLLVAGRLCLRSQLWGRARSYFEASQSDHSRPDALLELGHLFDHIDQPDQARTAYRKGLELSLSQ